MTSHLFYWFVSARLYRQAVIVFSQIRSNSGGRISVNNHLKCYSKTGIYFKWHRCTSIRSENIYSKAKFANKGYLDRDRKSKTLRSRTTINTSGTYLQAVCKVETFLSGEKGKNVNRIMFNLLPNDQNPTCQGDLSAFLCIHAFPLATCVKVALLVFSSWPYDLALTTQ